MIHSLLVRCPLTIFLLWLTILGRGSSLEAQSRPRSPWTTSKIVGSPNPPKPMVMIEAFPKLRFNNPVLIRWQPELKRYFVGELQGRVVSFDPSEATEQFDVAIELRKAVTDFPAEKSWGVNELYGMEFDPDFVHNRHIYLCYVLGSKTAEGVPNGTRLSRFKVVGDVTPSIDPASETILLEWLGGGHNGGDLAFGPDGMLYIATGDGAGPSPPDMLKTGQNVSDLLGSILRIDVRHSDSTTRYRIPKDNPFIDLPNARHEVWAYGFRNPWRMSFDFRTGQLWTGDVGWELWEMVQRVDRGGNYGWSIKEGHESILPDQVPGPTPVLPPQLALPHSESASITGGYVYRGPQFPELQGTYLCGDWATGCVWSLPIQDGNVTGKNLIAQGIYRIVSFGLDREGELLIAHHGENTTLFRLSKNKDFESQRASSESFPQRLSQTGLFADTRSLEPAEGVEPYSLNHPQWMDGATAIYHVAVPGKGSIQQYDSTVPSIGLGQGLFQTKFTAPEGTVLAKTISIDLDARADHADIRRLETQVLHYDGLQWQGYSYLWSNSQNDATLVESSGTDIELENKHSPALNETTRWNWRVSSRSECMQCHNPWADHLLGFVPVQLHRAENSDWMRLHQCQVIETRNAQKAEIDPVLCVHNTLTSIHDPTGSIEDRARAYLHVNCASCHLFGGGGTVDMSLKAFDSLEAMKVMKVAPAKGTFQLADPRIVAPGQPQSSVLLYRIATPRAGRMPHLGSRRVDSQGVALIDQWIRELDEQSTKSRTTTLSREELTRLIEQVTMTDDVSAGLRGAIAIHHLHLTDTPSPALPRFTIETLYGHPNPLIADLFECFLPSDQHRSRLGTNIDLEKLLAVPGDVERGKRLFLQGGALQCSQCHRVGEQGTAIGPDLTKLSTKRSRRQLLESLLEPSRTVEEAYRVHTIQTEDGLVQSGLVIERTNVMVKLKDARGETIELATEEILRDVVSDKSMMPDQVLRDLSAQQAADLLSYLESLQP